MKKKTTRWLAFHQLALNLSVKFEERIRDDLVNEATIKCMNKFDKWDQKKNPFNFFTSVAYNRMADVAKKQYRCEKHEKPLDE